ncbi:EthD family reductase [Mycolicibacterium sp. XJ1819]
MFRVSVCYGHPDDPAAFDAYYTDTHIPLALKVPCLSGLSVGKCHSIAPGEAAPYYMVASLTFDTAEDLQTALTSPEMAAASADVANFATGGVTVYSTEETQKL